METSKKHGMICLSITIGACIGLFIKLFAVDILSVSGHSMEPTLNDSSKIIVNRLAYGIVRPFSPDLLIQWSQPELNDIVIYLHDNKIVVKRCVGLSGDHLEFLMNSGYIVKVNNIEISLTPVQYQMMKNYQYVPEGYIFALGDNQEESVDSRDYGFVSVKNITGKIIGK